jgi:hypothetical protein
MIATRQSVIAKPIYSILCILVVLLVSEIASAQTNLEDKKGSWYAFWGWNRGFYTKSDIRFAGETYDFTLSDVKAKDRPSPFDIESYFYPLNVSVPQTNWRLGYFITDDWEISLGQDHMKYVMVQNQKVLIDGTINGSKVGYNKEYHQEEITLTPRFLEYEHTDGLNYFNTELIRQKKIRHFSLWKTPIALDHIEGIGIGALIPRSATDLLHYERYDRFHLAGYGVSVKAGLNIRLGQYFFIETELKGGYINMPWIRTTKSSGDHAEQSFFFFQPILAMGSKFLIK